MTVAATTNRVPYSGDGVSTVFSFPYFLIQKADLLVLGFNTANGQITTYALTTDYTIAGTAAANGTYPSGVNVTMLVPPATGTTLVLVRIPDFLQSTHWVDADPDPSAVKELAYDKLTLEVQRLKDQMARAVLLPDGYAGSFSPALPSVIPANSPIVTSADGLSLTFGIVSVVAFGSAASPVSLAGPIAIEAESGVVLQTWYIFGGASSVDLSALTPQIAAGTVVGQRILLVGCDNTNTVKISNGNGLILNGFYVMANGSQIELSWDGTNWREISRNEL